MKALPLEPTPGGVTVAGLSQARKHKRRFDAVITVEDPACRPADRLRFSRHPAPPHLVLTFEDVDHDTLGVRVATREQVSEALEFASAHKGGALLVHCFHGVGRSAAIALAILAERLGAGRERDALTELLRIRPEATPNLVVVKLSDEILGRGGDLVSTLAEWEATEVGVREKRQARLDFVQAHPELYSRF